MKCSKPMPDMPMDEDGPDFATAEDWANDAHGTHLKDRIYTPMLPDVGETGANPDA